MGLSAEAIETELADQRRALCGHPIYAAVTTVEDLRLFMEHHVFAVWDFMSLLKWLQHKVTCVEVPWVPAADNEGARLVNEIVLGEESDELLSGGYASHFEMYRDAMAGLGASTAAVDAFVGLIGAGETVSSALDRSGAPPAAREFVQSTFAVLATEDVRAVASGFAYGREDILPSLFERVCADSDFVKEDPSSRKFRYYLDRHIELDGDTHGPMAARLIEVLCGEDPEAWGVVARAASEALSARRWLWDGIYRALIESKPA
ncbi:MAG: DUF3050 domain-containing protein [Planctomycetota bacterium]